jgi:hypothetical protein
VVHPARAPCRRHLRHRHRLVQAAYENLAGGFANLVNWRTTLLHRSRDGVVPEVDERRWRQSPDYAGLLPTASSTPTLGSQSGASGCRRRPEPGPRSDRPVEPAEDPDRGIELDRLLVRHLHSATAIVDTLASTLPVLAGLSHQLTPAGGRLPFPRPAYPLLELPGPDAKNDTPVGPYDLIGGVQSNHREPALGRSRTAGQDIMAARKGTSHLEVTRDCERRAVNSRSQPGGWTQMSSCGLHGVNS